ncbi:hypothetical protein TRFO_01634 [Tritrichomonas foetus]|uniref:Uncharacterized protein n=1 Tax=Tritrichomonas foetus TaxID=1144522 RepID=A0A1J4JU71_9EUKA|nr:hypothetical protein TRFO_01634 [Tritrichomonas foetus]|eukprot:OHT01070.1 hypothetical protein TRFO_01634 [Tritrichomonas foetus]
MDKEVSIFQSVFTNLLNSFSSSFTQIIAEYETISLRREKISDNFVDLFSHFPREIPTYRMIINDLSEVATCNPPKILRFLGKMVNKTIKGKSVGIIRMSNPIFDAGNNEHRLIYHYFSLILFSDLICQIAATIKTSRANIHLVQTGFNIANKLNHIPEIDNIIIDQWAVILSIVSEYSCMEVTSIFKDFSNYERAFRLLKYTRFDFDDEHAIKFMFNEVIPELNRLAKKKLLIPVIFHSVGTMLLSCPYNEDIYGKLFDLAYHKRVEKEANDGAVLLCLILLQRYPKKKGLLDHFAEKRLFSRAFFPDELLFSLKGFQLYMFGRNLDPSWYFWEWGDNSKVDRLAYIKWNSYNELNISDPDHFISIFMKYYFPIVNYCMNSKEMDQFSSIITHIASLDFETFITDVVPSFLELNEHDTRFIAFVSSIQLINSDSFIHYAYKDITHVQRQSFNMEVRPKLIKVLVKYKNKNVDAVPFESNEMLEMTHLDECDRKIQDMLDCLKINVFSLLSITLTPTEYVGNDSSINTKQITTLNDILTDDDLASPEIFKILVKMSYDHNRKVSSLAFKICKDIISNPETNLMSIEVLLECLKECETCEATYVIMSLIFHSITSSDLSHVTHDMIYHIESSAFFCMCTAYPLLRHISSLILKKINQTLHNRGILYFLAMNIASIETNVKARMLAHLEPKDVERIKRINSVQEIPHPKSSKSESDLKYPSDNNSSVNHHHSNSMFDDEVLGTNLNLYISSLTNRYNLASDNIIKFEVCLTSHFYDIWLIFIQEILNMLIEVNYTPLLNEMSIDRYDIIKSLGEKPSPSSIGIGVAYTTTIYHLTSLKKYKTLIREQYSPFTSNALSESHSHLRKIIKKWITTNDDWKNDLAIEIIQHSHFTALPRLLGLLASAPVHLFDKILKTILIVLRSPDITQQFIQANIKKLIIIISNAQSSIQNLLLNETRYINWDEDSEQKIFKNRFLVINFCDLCSIVLGNGPSEIPDILLSHDTRHVMARFFFNWTQTKSEHLEKVRLSSKRALSSIIKIGPIFSDRILFDENCINLFGQMESEGYSILTLLLYYHYEELLNDFIKAVLLQPIPISEYYFRAIIDNLNENHSHFSSLLSGPLLFLGLVSSQCNMNKNYDFLCKLLRSIGPVNQIEHTETIIETMRQTSPSEILPVYFKYATEAVFSAFFSIIKNPKLCFSVKDIVNSILPWVRYVRLLPSQTTCAQGISTMFAFFTPYQFLENLIKATESVDEYNFVYLTKIWSELIKTPDHTDLIPIFISGWENQSIKQSLYKTLIKLHPVEMLKRLINNLKFSYYFHIVVCQKECFDLELWICPLIIDAMKNHWDQFNEKIPALIHFSFLFRTQVPNLFEFICKKMNIEYPDPSFNITNINGTIHQFINNLHLQNQYLLQQWCDESLKWTFGSPNLVYSASSFYIHNKIVREHPSLSAVDKNYLSSLIKIISYHISNDIDQFYLSMIVTEAIETFRQNYHIAPNLAYLFCSCFLDCRQFVVGDSLISALPIFRASMSDPDLLPQLTNLVISIIRPTIPRLENSPFCRHQLSELIKILRNDEMVMITVPLKNMNSSFFKDLISTDLILERSSISALCKALDHYALMTTTASTNLLDCIFDVSSFIVTQVVDENNSVPLAKIYSKALTHVAKCGNSIKFIKTIAKKQPNIVGMDIIDVFEWDRTLDSVARNLNQISQKSEASKPTITDVPNFRVVENFLFVESPPKILPFEAERELLINMINATKPRTSRRAFIMPKTGNIPLIRAAIKPTDTQLTSSSSSDGSWDPIHHPIALINDSSVFHLPNKEVTVSKTEYLLSEKTSLIMVTPKIKKDSSFTSIPII